MTTTVVPLRKEPRKVERDHVQVRLGGIAFHVPKAPLVTWFGSKPEEKYQLRVSGVSKIMSQCLVDYFRKGFGHEDAWLATVSPDLYVELQIWAFHLRLDPLREALVRTVEHRLTTNPQEARRQLRLMPFLTGKEKTEDTNDETKDSTDKP